MEDINIIVGVAGIIILGVFIRYRPWLDITKEGDVLLWYNGKCKREYKALFNIFNHKK